MPRPHYAHWPCDRQPGENLSSLRLSKRSPSWQLYPTWKQNFCSGFRFGLESDLWRSDVVFSTSRPSSVSNCESNLEGKFQNGKCAVFRFVPEQIVANQLSLFDLGAKVPKRIVKYNFRFSIWKRKFQNKSWVWLMTIRFGLATTTEWRKSTRTVQTLFFDKAAGRARKIWCLGTRLTCSVITSMPRPHRAHWPCDRQPGENLSSLRLSKRSPSWHAVSNLKAEFLFRVSIRIGKWFMEKWRWSFRLQDQVPYRIVNPISALASSLRFGGQVPKRKVRGFSICSRTNCGKSAFSFRFGSESSKTNSEI